jgi:hypothetical protein
MRRERCCASFSLTRSLRRRLSRLLKRVSDPTATQEHWIAGDIVGLALRFSLMNFSSAARSSEYTQRANSNPIATPYSAVSRAASTELQRSHDAHQRGAPILRAEQLYHPLFSQFRQRLAQLPRICWTAPNTAGSSVHMPRRCARLRIGAVPIAARRRLVERRRSGPVNQGARCSPGRGREPRDL